MGANPLFQAMGRAFFGELGDKTFLLTAVFAAWCPWSGVRSSTHVKIQQTLVFAGALAALAVRAVLVGTVNNPMFGGVTFNGVACGLLLCLALRAYQDASREATGKQAAERNPFDEDKGVMAAAASEEEQQKQQEDQPQWNRSAFSTPVPTPENYGSTISPPSSADGTFGERPSDRAISDVLAFVAPLIMCFIVEACDESQRALMASDPMGPTSVIGAILGYFLAVVIAVGCGMLFERVCTDTLVAAVVCVLLLVLTIASVGDAFLQLPSLKSKVTASVVSAPSAVASLLQTLRGSERLEPFQKR